MKQSEIQVPESTLLKPEYSCLFVDSQTNLPQRIQSYSQVEVWNILSATTTQRVLMNCNQDVLLIMQSASRDSYFWTQFPQIGLDTLDPGWQYPLAISNSTTDIPLFLATVTPETIRMSLETGNLIMWSKSCNKLWIKWDTSWDYLRLRQLFWDSRKKVFFAKVFPATGGVCHEKIDAEWNLDKNGVAAETCFRRVIFER